ncbi:MAG: fibronectin type III domain-containing protein [Desulfuromonadales bacterium]|nr:fibronectin type III domain-containing protein [Desulfuromonadales bacterium]
MKKIMKCVGSTIAMLSMMIIGLALAGCGGGSSGGVVAGGLSSQVVSGTAAAGAPLSGSVSIKDSSSPSKLKTAVIGSDGSFAFDVTDMKAPFVLQANGTSGGTVYKLHSYAGGTGIANTNPLSDIIVAGAAGVDDPATVYDSADPAILQKVGSNLSSTVATVQQKLQPLLALYGAEQTNPVSSPFSANHQGLDGMFDKVTITLSGGVFTIQNAQSSAVICTGSVTNIANCSFSVGNMPSVTVAPVAPATVAAVGGSGQVTLTWSAVTGATSYNLYYATSPGVSKTTGTKIANAVSPYVHTGLAAGTTYYYMVTGVNSVGESAASPEASATTAAAQPVPTAPAAPTNVLATGGTNQVTLSWAAVSGATSYNVYYSTTTGVTKTNGTKISNATSPAVQAGLTASTTYFYIVTAVNSVGESTASTQVAATTLAVVPSPTVPAAPTGVTAVGGANQVTLTWSAVSGATSYNIYYATATGVTKTNGAKITNATSPYLQTGLVAGTAYFYIVTAVNSAGESVASAQATASTSAPAINGAALYTQYCFSCHGNLGPRTAAQVSSAIASFGAMSQFRATGSTPLSDAQIAAIAASM